jgi:hypothetical protein
MTVVSNGDVNRIRNASQVICKPVLNIVPLVQGASAQVALTPVVPFGQLVVNTTVNWNNVFPGQLFSIKSGSGQVKTWGVARNYPTSTVFFCDAKSEGDGGYARDIMQTVVAGDTLQVYSARPAWALLSRIAGETIYKMYDVPYDGSGSTPTPICNIKYEPQVWANASGYGRVTFDASTSFDWYQSFAGIQSYLWAFPAGTVIVTGTLTSAVVTVDLPLGTHEIICTVTSRTGRQSTGFRWCFVNSTDPNSPHAPYNWRYGIEAISGDTENASGREITFTLRGKALDTLYPGAMCVFTNRVYFDDVELSDDVYTRHFVGYMDEVGTEITRGTQTTTIKFYSPLKLAQSIPTATQLMEESASPMNWTQVLPAFTHPAFAAYYTLRHHTTLLYTHNFGFNLNLLPYRRRIYGLRQETVGGQLLFIGEISSAQCTCKSDTNNYN